MALLDDRSTGFLFFFFGEEEEEEALCGGKNETTLRGRKGEKSTHFPLDFLETPKSRRSEKVAPPKIDKTGRHYFLSLVEFFSLF